MARLMYYGIQVYSYILVALLWISYFVRDSAYSGVFQYLMIGLAVLLLGFVSAYLVYGFVSEGYSIVAQVHEIKCLNSVSRSGRKSSKNIICIEVEGVCKWFFISGYNVETLVTGRDYEFWIEGAGCTALLEE